MSNLSPQISEFFNKVSQYIFRPFSSWDAVRENLAKAPHTFIGLDSKTGVLYLCSGLVVAFFVYRSSKNKLPEAYQRSFFSYVFPKAVYGHPSAIVDYKYVGFDLLIKFFLYIPITLGVSQFAYIVFGRISIDVSFGAFTSMNYYLRLAIITLLGAAIVDFSVFFAHFTLHKIPFLWAFHEVHHSAEVLTPVTVHRVHPVEELTNATMGGVVSGILAATYTSISGDTVQPVALFGLNIVSFVYYLAVYQLRHSHIWLSYGPVASYVFMSPAQHQIHHSIDKKHWNKNYGFTFSLWDWIFRSLYIPTEREDIKFGVPDVDSKDYSTVPRLYLLPFVKSARRAKQMISSRSLKFDVHQVGDPYNSAILPAAMESLDSRTYEDLVVKES